MAQANIEPGTSQARVVPSTVAPHWLDRGLEALAKEPTPAIKSLIDNTNTMTYYKLSVCPTQLNLAILFDLGDEIDIGYRVS